MLTERLTALALSPEAEAFARGILLGERASLDAGDLATFRMAGMSHILAVSGLHIGLLYGLLCVLCRPLRWFVVFWLPERLWAFYVAATAERLLPLFVLAYYVHRIGAPPSAVRAYVMLTAASVGWIVHREVQSWRTLLLAALLLIAWSPEVLTSPGFYLSFFAVASILLSDVWIGAQSTLRWWQQVVVLSVVVQAVTAPFVAYWFHQVPCLGWVQGWVAVPLLPLFLSAVLAGLLWPQLPLFRAVIELVHAWLVHVAHAIVEAETMLFGGHLYFYPSLAETLLLEALFLTVLLYLRHLTLHATSPS